MEMKLPHSMTPLRRKSHTPKPAHNRTSRRQWPSTAGIETILSDLSWPALYYLPYVFVTHGQIFTSFLRLKRLYAISGQRTNASLTSQQYLWFFRRPLTAQSQQKTARGTGTHGLRGGTGEAPRRPQLNRSVASDASEHHLFLHNFPPGDGKTSQTNETQEKL